MKHTGFLAQLFDYLFSVLTFGSESLDDFVDPMYDFDEILFLISSGGHRRGTDSHAGSLLRGTLFTRNAVLIQRDADLVTLLLQDSTAERLVGQIEQDQMVVCAAGHDLVAQFDELVG